MEQNNENKSFLLSIMTFIKFTIFLFLVYLYFENWIRLAMEGNWLLFAVMSIIPAMMVYCVIEEIYNNSNNVYSDVVDTQIKAWKKQ
jgi:hypothetical protein